MNSTLISNVGDNDSKTSLNTAFTNIKNIINFCTRIILYAILTMLIGAFLLFVLYFVDMLINISNGNSKVPLFNAYIIITPSMVPTINVNDAIVIKRVNEGELEIDDIITFTSTDKKYNGLTITHRIVGTETLQNGEVVYRTKGDANNVNDSALVSLDNIHGKVILRIPLIGNIQTILSSSSGWLFFIVIPCLGIIAFDIFKLFKAFYLKKILKDDKSIEVDKSKVKLVIKPDKSNIITQETSVKENIVDNEALNNVIDVKNNESSEFVVEEKLVIEDLNKNFEEEEEEIEIL